MIHVTRSARRARQREPSQKRLIASQLKPRKGKDIKWIFFQYAYHKNPTHMVVECTKVEITDRWELYLGDIIHFDNNHIDNLTCESYNNWYRSLES